MERENKHRSDATSRNTDNKEKRSYRSGRGGASEGARKSFSKSGSSSRGGYGRRNNDEEENRTYGSRTTSSRGNGSRTGGRTGEGKSYRSGRSPYEGGSSRTDSKGYKSGAKSGYKSDDSRSYGEKKSYGKSGGSYSKGGNTPYKKRYKAPDRDKSPEKFLNTDDGSVRLNKYIANSGICSRREADTYIEAGLVTVNGKIVTELGTKVMATDDVRFNGQRLKGEQKVYIVMNKPKGYVTTLNDPHAEKTVMDLISREKCPQRVFPIGRLDKATTGVLMLTNDGAMAEKLMHPSFETKKIYHVTLDKNLKGSDFNAIIEGIHLEDGEIHADSLSYVDEDKSQVGIEIHSGRNRIVRRIFEHLGYKVKKLDRVYFAGFTKKNLKRGQWRFLTQEEINLLMMGGAR